MTDPLAEQDDCSTPLSTEEREGLIPSYVTIRGELNEAEQANILEADAWAFTRKRNVLDQRFLNTLHLRMYGNVWRWAGVYRKSQKNIGVDYYKIPTELRALLDDCRYWLEHNTYPADEIAARFHHRLVSIHCYPNGNGRHARLAADLLLASLGRKILRPPSGVIPTFVPSTISIIARIIAGTLMSSSHAHAQHCSGIRR